MKTQAQTQTNICIQKKKHSHRFFMKKHKSHLKLVFKEEKPENSGFIDTASNFENEAGKMVKRPETSMNKILAQLSPYKYAAPGIKIA